MTKKFSFDNLMNENWDYVYGYILKQTNNTYLSEEITIQAFSKAFEKIDLYDDNYSFKTWIVSIAKNHLRDKNKKKKILFENLDQIDSNIYKSHDDPEKNLIAKESLSELNNKIEELKPMYREILKLKYIEDYSLNEISKKLNQPINTIKIKIFRAKKILNKLIED